MCSFNIKKKIFYFEKKASEVIIKLICITFLSAKYIGFFGHCIGSLLNLQKYILTTEKVLFFFVTLKKHFFWINALLIKQSLSKKLKLPFFHLSLYNFSFELFFVCFKKRWGRELLVVEVISNSNQLMCTFNNEINTPLADY